MNVLVCGSRNTNRVDLVFRVLKKELRVGDIVIHGGAGGVDSFAEAYCVQNKVNRIVMRPVYPSKTQYYLYRNAEMVGMCDRVVVFWDGKSRGTKFVINYARKRLKPVKVYKLDRNGVIK